MKAATGEVYPLVFMPHSYFPPLPRPKRTSSCHVFRQVCPSETALFEMYSKILAMYMIIKTIKGLHVNKSAKYFANS